MGAGAAEPLPGVCGEWVTGRGVSPIGTHHSLAVTTLAQSPLPQPTVKAVNPNCPEYWDPQEISFSVYP